MTDTKDKQETTEATEDENKNGDWADWDIDSKEETLEFNGDDELETFLMNQEEDPPTMDGILESVIQENTKSVNNNKTTDSDGYTVVGGSIIERQRRQVFEERSKVLVPVNLPLFESLVYISSETKHRIPLSITIRPLQTGSHGFKNARVMVAMLKILQMSYQDTFIGPIDETSKAEKLAHHSQVPIVPELLKQYMVAPVMTPNNTYNTKIVIHSNHELKEFKTHPVFLDYEKSEGIQIEINKLKTVIPCNVGFLEQVVPRFDTCNLHEERLLKVVPPGCPLFQVKLHKSFGADGKPIMMVMIQGGRCK
jgi:hypothetical protein